MDLLARIEYQQGFSELEKQVANYLLDNKDIAASMSLKELSEATYISTSTISRFCRKMGEKSYNDFRVHFASSIKDNNKNLLNFSKPFEPTSSKEEVLENISEIYKQTIEDTQRVLDVKDIIKAVKLLKSTKVIDVYGFGDSYLNTLMFEHKMTTINKYVNQKSIPTDQYKQAMYSSKDTVALVVSYTGETDEVKNIVDRIVENGGKIIAITSINDSYLRRHATVSLNMCSKEHRLHRIAAYSSKISGDYIIDLLYSMLFQDNYQIFLIDKINLEKKWDL